MSLRLALAALLVQWLIVGLAATAWAQPRLDYQAPSDCPDVDIVSRSLVRRVEPQPDGRDERVVTMRVTDVDEVDERDERVENNDERFVLEITLAGPDVGGARQISGRDCATLVDAGVVIVALALGPRPGVNLLEPDESPGVTSTNEVAFDENSPGVEEPVSITSQLQDGPEEPAEVAVEEPSEGDATPAPQRTLHLGGWLQARLSIGVMPAPAAGLSVGIGLSARRLRGELALQLLPKSEGFVQGEARVGGEFALLGAEVRLCGDVVVSPVVFGLCGGFEVGAIWARGFGADIVDSAWVVWIAPEVGALLEWPFTRSRRVALRIDAALQVPLYRSTFHFINGEDVHQSAPVTGRFGLGLAVHFF